MSVAPIHSDNPAARALAVRHRFRLWEALPWLLALAFYFAFPRYLGFGTEILITVLFAISLDLALGYAGIVTLGHAAFFGAGAYAVGMLAYHGIWSEPITSLIVGACVASLIGFLSGLERTSDLGGTFHELVEVHRAELAADNPKKAALGHSVVSCCLRAR